MGTEVSFDQLDDGIPEIEGAESTPLVLITFFPLVVSTDGVRLSGQYDAILVFWLGREQLDLRQACGCC